VPVRKLLLVAALLPNSLLADDVVRVAVASNFIEAAAKLAKHFSETTAVSVRISSGSTGKLYAQIINGAPFDVFLAADTERPRLLEQGGYAVPGSRATYATGALVLWSGDRALVGRDCREVLQSGDYQHLAIANPETAPYGAAAKIFLTEAGLWEDASRHTVFGENIAQTLQFVATGNATLGFVAASQMSHRNLPPTSCMWHVPESDSSQLDQQLVLLSVAEGNEAANDFVNFLASEQAAAIIAGSGYRVAGR